MVEAFVAMATSHLARAHARGQRFADFEEFLEHAEAGTLDIAPRGDSQWLPDSLREEMLWRHEELRAAGEGSATLMSGGDGRPLISIHVPSQDLDYAGDFQLDAEGNVTAVTVGSVWWYDVELPDPIE